MKIKLLFISLMCAASLFAKVNWYDVETQADVDVQVNKNTAQAILNVKLTPGYPFNSYAELKENTKTAVKPVNSQSAFFPKSIVFWMVSHTNGLKKYSQDLLNDADPEIKNLIINNISRRICPNFSKEQKNEFIKNNIVNAVAGKNADDIKKNGFRQMLDYYVKNIMPIIDEAEAKKTLKTLNKYIYPLIGEDDEMKSLAVKIRLALESLQ